MRKKGWRGKLKCFFFFYLFFCEILLFRVSEKTKVNELRRRDGAANERAVAKVCFEEKQIRVIKRDRQCCSTVFKNKDTVEFRYKERLSRAFFSS